MNLVKPHPTWNIFDSSKINTFMECPRKYFYRYILGWDISKTSVHLVFGEAWHRAMAVLLEMGYSSEAIDKAYERFNTYYNQYFSPQEAALNSPKNPDGAIRTLIAYAAYYKMDRFIVPRWNDIPSIEIAGTVPISNTTSLHFRLDAIIKDIDGKMKILEHKTSSQQTQHWSNQWMLSFQVGTYLHALNCLYEPEEVGGLIVNGAFIRKTEPGFQRVPVVRTGDAMNNWLFHAQYWVEQVKHEQDCLQACNDEEPYLEAFPMVTTSCSNYGTCQYHNLCMAWNNPLQCLHRMPPDYECKWWNPADQQEDAKHKLNLEKGTPDNATT